MKRVLVDSARTYTPRRAGTNKAKLTVTFTDHFPVIVDLEMPRSSQGMKGQGELEWNTSKPGGWETFEETGEREAARIAEIVEDEGYSREEVMEKVEKVHNKMKWTAFGKTKPRTKKAQSRETIDTTINEDKAKLLRTKETERLEAEILKVKATKTGRTSKVFSMREVISGAKKVRKEAHALIDTKTKKLVVANSEIKKVTLDYCLDVLKNNEPAAEVKELVKLKEMVHEMRMNDKERDEDYEISGSDFFETVEKFEAKKKTDPTNS